MGALMLIEELDHHGAVRRRQLQALDTMETFRVGRGWDCDLILEDAHVALLHIEITRDAGGGLRIRDCDSVNRIRLPRQREPVDQLDIERDAHFVELQLGTTRLRVHPTPPQLEPERLFVPRRRYWPYALAAILAAFVAIVVGQWLDQTREFRLSAAIGEALPWVTTLLVWSAGWALATRLFAGRLSYAQHVTIACVGVAVLMIFSMLVEIAAYSLSLSWLPALDFVPFWVVLAAILIVHLHVVGPGHQGLKAAAVVLIVAMGVAPQMIKLLYPDPDESRTHLVSKLQPPALRLAAPVAADDFLEQAAKLESRLEELREDEPLP